jgi:hypothetical protein
MGTGLNYASGPIGGKRLDIPKWKIVWRGRPGGHEPRAALLPIPGPEQKHMLRMRLVLTASGTYVLVT